jgi:hypothetical protein
VIQDEIFFNAVVVCGGGGCAGGGVRVAAGIMPYKREALQSIVSLGFLLL